MIKFILHGGSSNQPSPDTDAFYREMTAGSKGKFTTLLNYFSRKDEEVERLTEKDKARFLANSDNKELVFEVADRERFAQQMQRADCLFMKGGETAKLVDAMSRYENLTELFKDKVIAGSSSGAYVLSKYYWENDIDTLGDGLGFFNIKMFCHYAADQLEKVEKLRNYKENLPLLCLPDHKWVIMYQ